MSFDLTGAFSDEDMRDIITTALEAGSYGSFRIIHNGDGLDMAITVSDKYGDGEHGVINRATLKAGLEVLQAKYPRLLAELVASSYDVISADALLQAAAFGDVIYG